ncbi:MAG: hypothetical protein M4D80_36935 [Myxococcota bacterium]|nr:hypothetical protein [Myxococcota bacterium]
MQVCRVHRPERGLDTQAHQHRAASAASHGQLRQAVSHERITEDRVRRDHHDAAHVVACSERARNLFGCRKHTMWAQERERAIATGNEERAACGGEVAVRRGRYQLELGDVRTTGAERLEDLAPAYRHGGHGLEHPDSRDVHASSPEPGRNARESIRCRGRRATRRRPKGGQAFARGFASPAPHGEQIAICEEPLRGREPIDLERARPESVDAAKRGRKRHRTLQRGCMPTWQPELELETIE